MARTIKRVDITDALERVKKNEKVFVITPGDKPNIKNFNKIPVGDALDENKEYLFVVFEEA